jgi:ABC-type multidrug transport system fused ATPase/permease subunit
MAEKTKSKYTAVTVAEAQETTPVQPVSSTTGLKDNSNLGKHVFDSNEVQLVEGKSAEDSANFLSRWLYMYMDQLFKIGNSRTLMMKDLGAVSARDKCAYVEANFDKYWAEEKLLPKRKQSLWRVLWRMVGWDQLFFSMWYYAVYAGITYGPILILNALVKHFQGTAYLSVGPLWTFVALIFLLPMLGSIAAARSNAMLAHVSVQFRNVLVTKIYRKALSLSPAARQRSSTGQIINMFSTDTKQLQMFLNFMNNVALAPFQIIVALALIYEQVGVATFVGLGFMFFMVPLNGLIFQKMTGIRKTKVKETDRRVKLMNEILSGIRVIKYYAWENAFTQKINIIRLRELDLLKQLAYIVAIGFTLIMMSAPLVQPILIFFVYVKLGNQLDAAKAFTTLSLFNVLQFPFAFLPMGLAQYSQSMVSCKRMLDFLNSEELVEYVDRKESPDGVVLSMEKVHMCWISEEKPPDVGKMSVEERKDHEWAEKQKKKDAVLAEKEAKRKVEIAAKVAKDKSAKEKGGKGKGGENDGKVAVASSSPMKPSAASAAGAVAVGGAGTGKGTDGAGEVGVNRSYYTLTDVSFRVKKVRTHTHTRSLTANTHCRHAHTYTHVHIHTHCKHTHIHVDTCARACISPVYLSSC